VHQLADVQASVEGASQFFFVKEASIPSIVVLAGEISCFWGERE
jgi:hypothetical protein